jgi:hypothetical protein
MVSLSPDSIDSQTRPLNAPKHVMLRVPQSVARGTNADKSYTLQESDQLVYLVAARDNKTLTHRLNASAAVTRCGIERRTVTRSVPRLAKAGRIEIKEPGSGATVPLVWVPRPPQASRFEIPLALVWPWKAGHPAKSSSAEPYDAALLARLSPDARVRYLAGLGWRTGDVDLSGVPERSVRRYLAGVA